jgi:ppGpp synthetase/RelA/SpoT-type nucleotidyltranferase
MGVVEDAIARYKREVDFYAQACHLAAQLLDGHLQSSGVRAIVTSRAKNATRLEAKIRQRDSRRAYASVGEIFADLPDLAGVRVALYFPGERNEVGRAISELFANISDPKVFPEAAKQPTYRKRFSGYWATHYRVRIREGALGEPQKRYADAPIEIQVASVLMHAWAEVEHDLVYKPLQGRLSEDEYAILDELNGLVLAGEIALERLQRAGDQRVATKGRQLATHYDLASFLLDRGKRVVAGQPAESALGRIDLLFAFLDRLGLLTPEKVEPYLESLHANVERQPISEQIIDIILAEDPKRYPTYEAARSAVDSKQGLDGRNRDASEAALGRFLTKWVALEKFAREQAVSASSVNRLYLPSRLAIARLTRLDPQTRFKVEEMRQLRNAVIHGHSALNTSLLKQAAAALDEILVNVGAKGRRRPVRRTRRGQKVRAINGGLPNKRSQLSIGRRRPPTA